MSTSTPDGNYRTTAALTMLAFDKLPAEARAALAQSVENWVPQPLITAMRRRGISGAQMAAIIAVWDADELAQRERQRRRAVGCFHGNVPDRAIRRSRKENRL